MSPGIFFLVVGPSGSGKDTLIDGARAILAPSGRYHFARRVITRPSGAAGEDHDGTTEEAFAALEQQGRFLITWQAHGLHYGLPIELLEACRQGRHVIANGSRSAVPALAERVPRLVLVEVSAPAAVLARRIAGRGREAGADIAARLARPAPDLSAAFAGGVRVVRVANDGTPEAGIAAFVRLVQQEASRLRLRAVPIDTGRQNTAFLPRHGTVLRATDYLGPHKIDVVAGDRSIRAQVNVLDDPRLLDDDEIGLSTEAFADLGMAAGTDIFIRRTPSPESRGALQCKIRGGALGEEQYAQVVRDIVEGRYPDSEVAGFLVAANRGLSDDEVVSLARVRSAFSERIRWDAPLVVDKHSMGGIPGSRITLIVVPIVAAHGLTMPKTSSRAITSAAGTADAMETVARVDLSVEEVRRTVAAAGACIAWNGRLNHSALDDVMNAITRPLGLDSNRWSVASILSKKLTAGSTHVIVDLPYGPSARLKSRVEAAELATLFETVGAGLGLTVRAFPTDGTAPIGRGIGPALEVRDVLQILDNRPEGPADLREKALFYAGRIIAWDPAVGDEAEGRRLAEALLASGRARDAFDRIVDAQGRRADPILPAPLVQPVYADRSGPIAAMDGWAIAGIARRAGAPSDPGAGIDLLCRVGEEVRAGQPLFLIRASTPQDLDAAAAMAGHHAGIDIRETVTAGGRSSGV
ncbi:thymidine phosphorylase [Inquilinus ginsengisoli]|uniref:Multifunctional fusion protein n=1 Tax=Inquilinus ginsengisoli TaxID=363840 RepID=A0ABU1JUN5_9PROT|nr:phosphonate metabolism protein/1,5-bisphosphokinase (PRPP-forming) PhnN [Inquilinus ginsengisoli]MDR6292327.1 thymidine phosphorylase [Inquilinus ginsengisoli]